MRNFLDALEGDGSIFDPTRTIWTAGAIDDVYHRVVTNPDTSDRPFEPKLLDQLAGAGDQAVGLAAEALYVWYLKDNQTATVEKRRNIEAVLSLTSSPFRMPPDLNDRLARGLAHLGMSALHKWPQFHYVLHFARQWKAVPERWRELRKDPWMFREFVENDQVRGAPAQRLAFMHLVHPDTFEPVINGEHKKMIVRSFAGEVAALDRDVDRALMQIRAALSDRYGRDFQFYSRDIRPLWDPARKEAPLAAGPPSPSVPALHLVVKWSAAYGADTIERHQEVAAAHGAVWWGVLTTAERPRVGDSTLNTLRSQLRAGISTYAWLSGSQDRPLWKCEVIDVSDSRPAGEDDLIPAARIGTMRHKVWLKLRDFQEVERNWAIGHLEPSAQPGKLIALRNQTNPILVHERERPRCWWVNQGGSYSRARAGGYLWAPTEDRAGRALPHWDALRSLRVGDVVIHYANRRIRAIGRVEGPAQPAPRPDAETDESWGPEGWRVSVGYREINPEVDLVDIPQDWRRKERGVFNADGGVSQGYLFAVSDEFVGALDQAFPRLDLARGINLNHGAQEPSAQETVGLFDIDAVRSEAIDRGLILEDDIYGAVIAALESGKHVILTGPPGTGKTTLAEVVAGAARRAGRCGGFLLSTATADWTTYETIGGLKPAADGALGFAPGHFLDAIEKNEWLIIDELNRSNFDRAFGQLFTVLSGQPVELPYERTVGAGRLVLQPEGSVTGAARQVDSLTIPRAWRVIATMNVFDKSLLFEMSFALMRRFAFVEVSAPAESVFHSLIEREASPDPEAAELAKRHLVLRRFKDLGPAMFMDLARFFRARREISEIEPGTLAFEGFYAFLLPQLEGIEHSEAEELEREVRRLVGSRNAERLRLTLNAVLGLDLPERRVSVDELSQDLPAGEEE